MDAASASGCDVKPLCPGHATSHGHWGHDVAVLVESPSRGPTDTSDAAGMPAPDTMLGVTHCPLPEHAGPSGVYALWCKSCQSLQCRACGDGHLDLGHAVVSVDTAATAALGAITEALPALQAGLAHETTTIAQARAGFDGLASGRASAVAALAAHTARLHAQVDAQHAVALAELDAVYDAKVAALETALKVARSGAAELATVIAVAEAALQSSVSSTATTRVHASNTVAATMALATRGAASVDELLEVQLVGGKELPSDSVPKVFKSPGAGTRTVEDLEADSESEVRAYN